MRNNWLITIIVAIIVAAGAFLGGMQYQKSQVGGNQGEVAQSGQGGRFGSSRVRFGGATIGNVVRQDTNSITVQLQDGSSKIINISGNTTFSKTDTASKSDVQNGIRIATFGTANSDGSVNAQYIQINPQSMRSNNRSSM